MLLFLFFFSATCSVAAQESLITAETPVDDGVLHQWLHSGDPRLIAWAADFARRTHDAKIVSEMPALLEHWVDPKALSGDESEAAQRRAIEAVLDTLIQENTQVPASAITAIAASFPAQAAILIGRLPVSESLATLRGWTYGTTGGWFGFTLARIAAMMLAKNPGLSRDFFWVRDRGDVGFVASVVAASEEEVHITVSSSNEQPRIGTGNACGDSWPHPLTPGWPQVYAYDLLENDPGATAPIVVDLERDRIVSRRFEENRPPGSCFGVRGLDPSTRHQLIAYWLGIPEKEMAWRPVEERTILWTNKAAYQHQLGEITEAEREKLHATVEALRQRGLLTEFEAERIAPRLVVSVQCEIKPCPLSQ
ncbi:hypothetical protein [Granulicella sp. WH15]|uniref:hypothetical protein n=1 Tax=Granulicella sp. WH15 TaxID=2602070 RepID=UPI0013A546EC|nr:hypothetical protein [Granulicella sp. WH15]